MAIINTEGFGSSTAFSDYLSAGTILNTAGQSLFSISTGGSFGDNYLKAYSNANNSAMTSAWPLTSTISNFFIGMRMAMSFSVPGSYPGTVKINLLDNNNAVQVVLYINPFTGAGSIQNSGGTVLVSAAAGTFPLGLAWFYLEIGGTIATGTGGSMTVKVNGVTVMSLTGANTASAGTTGIAFVQWSVSSDNGNPQYTLQVAHLYACDNTGSAPYNTYLGDIRVQSIFPGSAGSSTQFTPTGASTNWQAVGVAPPAISTRYTSDSTVGDSDLFTVAGVTTGAVVLAVVVKTMAAKNSPGARTVANKLKSGTAATVSGTAKSLGTSPAVIKDVFTTDPNTSASWASAGVNAAQIGYGIAS